MFFVRSSTFVHSTDIRLFMPRLSCVQQTFVRSSPDFCAFSRFICVHQVFVRSCQDTCAPTRLSCFYVQIFVRSPDLCAFMTRLSCVFVFPDWINLNARHPRRAIIWDWTYRLSVCDPNLGDHIQNCNLPFCRINAQGNMVTIKCSNEKKQ